MNKAIVVILTIFFISPSIADIHHSKGWNMRHEGYHDCTREWWNIDVYLYNENRYHLTASFEYEKETPAANLFFTIFDLNNNIVYDLGSFEDDISSLLCNGTYSINLSYGHSWLKGSYPSYIVHLENEETIVHLQLIAESRPVLVLEEEGGELPMGQGSYQYTFVPKCKAQGYILINGNTEQLEGIAYYEHVWGNWSYHNPLKGSAFDTYLKLFDWWWETKNITFNSITFSTNNPFGYDWAWASFENGWSMFYGVVPFWIEEIPLGVIYLYNGENILEFSGLSYDYLDGKFINGFYIPTRIHSTAQGLGSLNFVMEMKYNPHIYEDRLDSIYWKKLMLYECPGSINGRYTDEKGAVTHLSGICEIEIERQISILESAILKISKTDGIWTIVLLSWIFNMILKIDFSVLPFLLQISFSNIR